MFDFLAQVTNTCNTYIHIDMQIHAIAYIQAYMYRLGPKVGAHNKDFVWVYSQTRPRLNVSNTRHIHKHRHRHIVHGNLEGIR